MNPNQSHIYQIFMKKKIYTFSLILFAFLFALYFVWSLAANIQKEALKQYLSNEWAVILNDEKITTMIGRDACFKDFVKKFKLKI